MAPEPPMHFALLLLMVQPIVQDKVADRFVPAPYDTQRLSGYLAERMKINLEGRLLHIDEQAVLAGFQTRPGTHPWIGEHVGKYLDAACNTWLYTQDPRLKTQMDRIAGELLKTQLPDGYFGTYADKDRWTSWDVWVHKYNLIGLLAYYRVTGDERALAACRRIGDLLAATFGEGKRDIIASSTHVGMAATSVLEPVVSLYRYTGEKRYLEFALYIVRSWEQPNGPRLLSSLLSHGRVDQTANAKAYEMMSDLVGLVDLYRVTGTEDYRKAATAAWTDIAARRVFPTGTTSTHEHFQADGVFPGEEANDVGEGCATVTWLQLSWQLLRLTGEAQYGEELERTVFNQLLAAQDTANGNICYFTPLNGRKRPGPGINCCVSSEPRGISMIPALTWGRSADGIDIELYTAGEYTASFPGGLKVKIKSETIFPASGDVTFTITPSFRTRFALNLRVPKWTARYTARVDKVEPARDARQFPDDQPALGAWRRRHRFNGHDRSGSGWRPQLPGAGRIHTGRASSRPGARREPQRSGPISHSRCCREYTPAGISAGRTRPARRQTGRNSAAPDALRRRPGGIPLLASPRRHPLRRSGFRHCRGPRVPLLAQRNRPRLYCR